MGKMSDEQRDWRLRGEDQAREVRGFLEEGGLQSCQPGKAEGCG